MYSLCEYHDITKPFANILKREIGLFTFLLQLAH